MREYRYPKRGSQYYLETDIYDFCVKYARLLPRWQKELLRSDCDRKEELQSRVDNIRDIALIAAGDEVMTEYLLKNVSYGQKVKDLQIAGMPCGKNDFARMKRRFYWELANMI